MLKKKMFKKRSISLYPDLKLRHVGFLGAVPPAVKGLPDFAFSEESEITSFEFAEESLDFSDYSKMRALGRMMRNMREWLIDKFDTDTANQVMPNWEVETLFESDTESRRNFENNKKEPAVEAQEFNEKLAAKDTEITNLSEKATKAETENAQLKAELAKQAKEKRSDEFSQFADKLVTDGKMLPAQKSAVVDLMEVLSGSEEYEFAEGGKKSPLDVFKSIMEAEKTAVEFEEVAVNGQNGSANHDKMEKLIKEKMDENDKLEYSEAFSQVQKENPELTTAYQSELV